MAFGWYNLLVAESLTPTAVTNLTANPELVVASIICGVNQTITGGSGWTLEGVGGSGAYADQIVSATPGEFDATPFTLSTLSTSYMVVVGFIIPGGFSTKQTKSVNAGNANNTISVTLSGAVTVGDMLTVAISWNNNNRITSVTDQLGNVYALLSTVRASRSTSIYWCASTVAGTPTLTVNFASNATSRFLCVTEYGPGSGVLVDFANVYQFINQSFPASPYTNALPATRNGKYLPQGLFELRSVYGSVGGQGLENIAALEAGIGWTTPGINGEALRISWSDLEPTQGSFFWDYTDAAVSLAAQYNRRFSILAITGIHCPAWVFLSPGITFFSSTSFAGTLSGPLTGTLANGQPQITGLSSTTQLYVGAGVSGTGVPGGATIISVDSSTQVTMSVNATASGSESISFTDRFPAPWDLVYQGLLASFVQAFAARYDGDENFAYVITTGFGYDSSQSFCHSTTDNATLAATVYNGVTGTQLWLNAFEQICGIWADSFRVTPIICNFYAVLYPPPNQTLSLMGIEEVHPVLGTQFGIKWNNLTAGTGSQTTIPYTYILDNPGYPAGLQMESANALNLPGALLIAQSINAWFVEIYYAQITGNPSLIIQANAYFIGYVNALLSAVNPMMSTYTLMGYYIGQINNG